MWRLGLVLHAAAWLFWWLLLLGAVIFGLDRCATFFVAGARGAF